MSRSSSLSLIASESSIAGATRQDLNAYVSRRRSSNTVQKIKSRLGTATQSVIVVLYIVLLVFYS